MFIRCCKKFLLLVFQGELQKLYKVKAKRPEFGTLASVLRYATVFVGALLGIIRLVLIFGFDIRLALFGDYVPLIFFLVPVLFTLTSITVFYYKSFRPVEGFYSHLNEEQIEGIRTWYSKIMVVFWIVFIIGLGWPIAYGIYLLRQ